MSSALSVNITAKTLSLSAREMEVLKLLSEGDTARQAGQKLGITAKTVEAHRENIKKKTGLFKAHQLVVLAMELGLLPIPTLKVSKPLATK